MKALARQYSTSPETIRRVLDDAGARALPDDLSALFVGDGQDDVADDAVRQGLNTEQTIRRGRATRCGSPPRSACSRR
ncbi:hypothetical protein OHU11_00850 [Streptomyces sp. NBC_00257]|uniref:hypothetical protein n=1 Tax=Streptomyces TaxID=1883 RepID=UPI00224EFB19|nr:MULTISPECIES: hypothetical protein [unclassified Streptomyces]WTB59408.1 hypothetical protein OG832_43100 [Streptomyces sp. NBC_00826]WTH87721.1 hypothetical protein OIC43_00620 [Streptomyces sp. NBC_00825]WTH96447.1 hypothetical protein OHA23_00630 [Streptomyces sp. NBC_00822]MCX4869910.1 hypothetical protein [Streptomyces sp. NBC_00906]MCX4901073.1 hypothetical protein [Streptomyces sp. NBC_00892]